MGRVQRACARLAGQQGRVRERHHAALRHRHRRAVRAAPASRRRWARRSRSTRAARTTTGSGSRPAVSRSSATASAAATSRSNRRGGHVHRALRREEQRRARSRRQHGRGGQVLQSNNSGAAVFVGETPANVWALKRLERLLQRRQRGHRHQHRTPRSASPRRSARRSRSIPARQEAGFGMSGNRLQIYGDNPNADVAIGWRRRGHVQRTVRVPANRRAGGERQTPARRGRCCRATAARRRDL